MKNCRRILSLSLCVILAVGTLLPSVVTAAPERAGQRQGQKIPGSKAAPLSKEGRLLSFGEPIAQRHRVLP